VLPVSDPDPVPKLMVPLLVASLQVTTVLSTGAAGVQSALRLADRRQRRRRHRQRDGPSQHKTTRARRFHNHLQFLLASGSSFTY
jgi:hypothetical protein